MSAAEPEEWRVTVSHNRVRIERHGQCFHTSKPFQTKGAAEGLAALFRTAIALHGHPFATGDNPDPDGPRPG